MMLRQIKYELSVIYKDASPFSVTLSVRTLASVNFWISQMSICIGILISGIFLLLMQKKKKKTGSNCLLGL